MGGACGCRISHRCAGDLQGNQLFIDHWEGWLLSALYYNEQSCGSCDLKLVLDQNHPYHRYFVDELDKVADGLEEFKKNGVVVFVNLFAETTGGWFWWAPKHRKILSICIRGLTSTLCRIGRWTTFFLWTKQSLHNCPWLLRGTWIRWHDWFLPVCGFW